MKITIFGDSLTWGGYGGNYVAHVSRLLPDHEIVNAGEGGHTIINLLRRVDEVLADEPDAIFVMVGGNDAVSQLYPDTRSYYKSTQKIDNGYITQEEFISAYRDLLTELHLNHVQTLIGLETIEYNRELRDILDSYNQQIRQIARVSNIPVLDLAAKFEPEQLPDRPPVTLKFIQQIGQRTQSGWDDFEAERQRHGYTYTFDGMHLTPQAAERVGEVVAEFLRESLGL